MEMEQVCIGLIIAARNGFSMGKGGPLLCLNNQV